MKVPSGWNDVRLVNLLAAGGDHPPGTRGEVSRLGSLVGIDAMSLTVEHFNRLAEAVASFGDLPSGEPLAALLGCQRRDLSTVTLGEFIDVESGPRDVGLRLALMYPSDQGYVPAERRRRAEEMLTVSVDEAWPALESFRAWRESVFRTYDGLFEQAGELDVEGLSQAEARELRADVGRDERWSWYRVLLSVASGDPLRMEEASEMNLFAALNFLSHQKIFT